MHQYVAPILDGHRPFVRYMHCNQIELLQKGIVADKRALGFCDLPQLAVEILNGVRGVDNPPYLLGIF